ncbi:MAG: hypothetical protein LV481_15995 [Methylacidiphilales bacterium]|nr:hypothetical protein [Candidatus Methylacidiphilales bacterium]
MSCNFNKSIRVRRGVKKLVGKPKKAGGATRVGKMVQVAPSLFVPGGANPHPPPESVFCNVVENGAGLFRLEPRTWERFERVNGNLSRKLGLGTRTDTLRRLIRGGFVAGARVAPKLYTLNLASYWTHYDRCVENPDFWANPKVRAEYWTAI